MSYYIEILNPYDPQNKGVKCLKHRELQVNTFIITKNHYLLSLLPVLYRREYVDWLKV